MDIVHDGVQSGAVNPRDLHRAKLLRTAAGRTSTPYFLVTIGNAISWGSAREYLHHFGVGVNEWRVMAHIANDPGCTANDMAQFLRIHKAVVSRSLKSLISKGLVGVDTSNGSRGVFLTEEGVARHDAILPVALRREEILLDGLDESEREMLLGMLRKLHANLSSMSEFDHLADDQGRAAEPW